jgi:succinate dehydrogenase/fumarate reductase flavoprotein subunit
LNVTEAYMRKHLPVEVVREALARDEPRAAAHAKPDHRSPEIAAANRAAAKSLMGG